MAGYDTGRIIAAYQAGVQLRRQREGDLQAKEDRKLEIQKRQLELKAMQLADKMGARDEALQNAKLMQGQVAPQVSSLLRTQQAPIPESLPLPGVPARMGPAPAPQAIGRQTVALPLPKVNIPGVYGPDVQVRPQSLQDLQRMAAEEAQQTAIQKEQEPFNLPVNAARVIPRTGQVFTNPQTAEAGTPEERFINLKLREAATQAGGELEPQQEAAARLAARNEWTAAGRENDPALDEMNLRIKEMQVEMAEQRLRAAQNDLTPEQLRSALSLGNALKSHAAYIDMLDIHTGILGVETGLAQQNGFGDITAINAFQRMVDPGATVRSEDVVLLQSASSILQKILSDYPIDKLRTGAKLPDAVRAQMRQTARQLYETRAGNYNATIGQQYKALASAAKIPFEYVGQDFPLNASGQAGVSQPAGAPRGALPAGRGRVIDRATAQQFYEAAGGDPVKARTLAEQNGWKVQ